MIEYEQVLHRLMGLMDSVSACSYTVYRSCSVQHANSSDLLTGEGSRKGGGRWNPKGIRAVYGSLTPETGMAETLRNFRYYGLDISKAMPRVFVAVRVSLENLLDLTRGAVRQKLGISMRTMQDEDWRMIQRRGESLTQNIGRAAFALALEGLLVPSAVDSTGEECRLVSRQFGSPEPNRNLRRGQTAHLNHPARFQEEVLEPLSCRCDTTYGEVRR